MNFSRRLPVLCLVLVGLFGATQFARAEAPYEPVRAQAGKDVIWIPTSQSLVDEMLTMAKVTSKDLVYDLGSGDGIIAVTAGKKFGARAVGIEFNPKMAEFATQRAKKEGVSDKVTFINGDIFVEDFSKATVVTMYLLPTLNLRLRPTLLDMPPGTRIVSHAFSMQEWQPDQTSTAGSGSAYMWIVPAKVAGEWDIKGLEGVVPGKLTLHQSFQQVGGTLTVSGVSQPLLGAHLSADKLSFSFFGPDKVMQSITATVLAGNLSGMHTAYGTTKAIEAKRL
jgi:hypothetical protein